MRAIVTSIMLMDSTDGDDWDTHLPTVERNINTAINKTTGYSPFKGLYGYEPLFEDASLVRTFNDVDDPARPAEIQQDIRETVGKKQETLKAYFDKKRYEPETYHVGDVVAVRRLPVSDGRPTKTQLRYKGPFVITAVLSKNMYRIERLGEDGPCYTTLAHISQLKIYRNHEDDLLEDEKTEGGECETFQVDEDVVTDEGESEVISEDETEEEWKPTSEENASDEHVMPDPRTRRSRKLPARYEDYDMAA